MTLAHLYTDFGTFLPGAALQLDPATSDLEDAQLAGFENGYQAGWDDAVKAKDTESEELSSTFVETVKEMSLTQEEASAQLAESMKPLMTRFVTSVLPTVARNALQYHLSDQIEKLISGQSQSRMELVVSPSMLDPVKEMLAAESGVQFEIGEDASLSDSQIYLRVNDQEREIDLDSILAEINAAVDAFFHTSEQEQQHG